MHENSLLAHSEEQASGKLGKRSAMIVDLLSGYRVILTHRQIMEHLGFTDMNSVRPRVSDLVKSGVLVEYDSVRDHVTGKIVRRVMRARGQQRLF